MNEQQFNSISRTIEDLDATTINQIISRIEKALHISQLNQFFNHERKTMTNVFTDQKTFMTAGDQTVDNYNESQYNMYLDLIKEEVQELQDAVDQDDKVEQLDALIDILVVVVGALHSLGADAEGAWNEVIRSNMSKVDPATGKVIKREDGKVLKPATYSAPELTPFLTRG